MAAPSTQTLQRIASETGHQLGTLEKVMRLLDILQEVARDRILSERLALKGGTRSTSSISASIVCRSISTSTMSVRSIVRRWKLSGLTLRRP